MDRKFWLGFAAYVIPTFTLGYLWHLLVFAGVYRELQVYRADVVIPLGLLSMVIQAAILSWLFPRVADGPSTTWLWRGLAFGAGAGLFAWSLSTIAVSAKHVMTSVPPYLLIETCFTAVQFAIVGPLIALAHRG